MKKAEILAPVGNIDMLYAGLAAGADSFYLALDDFGARAYAENFNLDNIEEIIDYIHLFDKKVFVTMNTLIKDSEMDKALYYAQKLYEYGVDGLLIQDIGFYSIIKDQVPGLDLHASTQMAVRDYHGAKALMDMGFKRIVIARETPIEEIRKIAKLPCEKEVFVHGSLCVSYSGECLMSSYFGERSANRGRCAGPCRLKYDLISDGKVLANDYFLNMKDLNVLDNIDELLDLSIDCLKIEGRMKSPEYVYTSVRAYKEKIEKASYNREKLRDISNRGYTKGFIFGQKSDYILREADNKHRSVGRVEIYQNKKSFLAKSDLHKGDNLEVQTERGKKLPLTITEEIKKGGRFILDKYRDAKVGSDILMLNAESIKDDLAKGLERYKNLGLDLYFKASLNEKASLKLVYKDYQVEVFSEEFIEPSQKIAIDESSIRENLDRFKDEIFKANTINIEIDDNIFIRKKTINKLRRDAIRALSHKIGGAYKREKIEIKKPSLKNLSNQKPEINLELMTNDISPDFIKGFDNLYIKEYDSKYKDFSLYLDLDSHWDYEIDDLISYIKGNFIRGVIFNSYRDFDFIERFKKEDIKIRIGRYLNVLNSYAFDFYSGFAEKIESSVENQLEIINKNAKAYDIEALVFGRIELMNMVHCPFSTIKKCGLRGCESCKFSKGEMKSANNDRMLTIRRDGLTKIYPYRLASFDESLLDTNLSMLVSVFSDEDLLAYQNKIKTDKLNYERGVI
ncbi:U32 family peptidase [Anaerococcus sp. NML200574]|uniref:peptidase U32 family protein n=1 Tax=Anaerococcus sp. NML200574 TaxID=2954486 RepID=UPI0022380AC1|nr:U32 family peptidase [Anaerococcus sp. NML200574]MCW6678906.1 U32 family peptidase [Anaerococcus sp. NML200574]